MLRLIPLLRTLGGPCISASNRSNSQVHCNACERRRTCDRRVIQASCWNIFVKPL